jgi:hypothetical protein
VLLAALGSAASLFKEKENDEKNLKWSALQQALIKWPLGASVSCGASVIDLS